MLPDGSDALADKTRVLSLTAESQTFTFDNIPATPTASLLRGFSAPLQLDFEQSDAELAHLMAHDSDAFNRWEAGQRLAGRIEEDGRACVIVVNKWDAVEKDSHTMAAMEKELRAKLYFLDWAPMLFTSALSGQRVESIFAVAAVAVEQHRRRVSTSVVNEVLQEAVSWRSPPTSRGGRQGRIYYGTQVATRPPSFTLFVNDPKLFGDTYRRYVERQIREGLGFEGSPLKLFWRGKQQRDAEKELARQQAKSH